MNNDYIIVVDENGQPFIAHGFSERRHKYWKKIWDGTRFRYFYTKEQIDAFLTRLKNRRRKRPTGHQKTIDDTVTNASSKLYRRGDGLGTGSVMGNYR